MDTKFEGDIEFYPMMKKNIEMAMMVSSEKKNIFFTFLH